MSIALISRGGKMSREEIRLKCNDLKARIEPLMEELEALRVICKHPAPSYYDDSADGSAYYTCPDCDSLLHEEPDSSLRRVT